MEDPSVLNSPSINLVMQHQVLGTGPGQFNNWTNYSFCGMLMIMESKERLTQVGSNKIKPRVQHHVKINTIKF